MVKESRDKRSFFLLEDNRWSVKFDQRYYPIILPGPPYEGRPVVVTRKELEEIDFYDNDPEPGQRFVGMPLRDVATLAPAAYDKIIVTQLENKDMGIEILDIVSISPEKLQTLFSHSNKEKPE